MGRRRGLARSPRAELTREGVKSRSSLPPRPTSGLGSKGAQMTMTTTIVLVNDATQVRAAVAGFLAGYRGSTRRSYATDLRLFGA